MRLILITFLAVWHAISPATNPQLVSAAHFKLELQTIRTAEGYIKYDYLIPGGDYKDVGLGWIFYRFAFGSTES